jgi:hypothetical protein
MSQCIHSRGWIPRHTRATPTPLLPRAWRRHWIDLGCSLMYRQLFVSLSIAHIRSAQNLSSQLPLLGLRECISCTVTTRIWRFGYSSSCTKYKNSKLKRKEKDCATWALFMQNRLWLHWVRSYVRSRIWSDLIPCQLLWAIGHVILGRTSTCSKRMVRTLQCYRFTRPRHMLMQKGLNGKKYHIAKLPRCDFAAPSCSRSSST